MIDIIDIQDNKLLLKIEVTQAKYYMTILYIYYIRISLNVTYDVQEEGLARVQEPPALAGTTAYPSPDSGTCYMPS